MPSGSHSSSGGSHFGGGGSSRSSGGGGSHFSGGGSSRSSGGGSSHYSGGSSSSSHFSWGSSSRSSSSSHFSWGSPNRNPGGHYHSSSFGDIYHGSWSPGGGHYHGPSYPRGGVHYSTTYYDNDYGVSSHSLKVAWRLIVISILILNIINTFLSILYCANNISDYTQKLNKCDADYEYYQAMCENAYYNDNYQTTAKVNGMYYNENAGKYYVTYTFGDNNQYYGETYSIYTSTEAILILNTRVTLAIDCNKDEINSNTDSILMDYYLMNKNKDGEYSNILSNKNNLILKIALKILLIILFIAISTFLMKQILKVKKTNRTKIASNTTTTTIFDDEEIETDEEDINENNKNKTDRWVCKFCGSVNSDDVYSCPSCGSRRVK